MDFDQHATTYQEIVNQAAGVSVERLADEKARLVLNVLADCVGDPRRLQVLDIGCGIGLVDRTSAARSPSCGASTPACIRSRSLAREVRLRASYSMTECVCHSVISSFDAVFTSCVLHHVPPPTRRHFMKEMLRPLRGGGVVIIIEHNPANPVTQRVVARCEFDADAVLLSCREAMRLMTDAGAAMTGRRFVGFSPFRSALVERAERLVGWLPIGAQYCAWGIKSIVACVPAGASADPVIPKTNR